MPQLPASKTKTTSSSADSATNATMKPNEKTDVATESVNEKQHFFYVLECRDKTFYAGYTIDVVRRLDEHNDGTGAKYTRLDKRRPVRLLHFESFDTRSLAMKQEYAFKQLSRKQKEAYLKEIPSLSLS